MAALVSSFYAPRGSCVVIMVAFEMKHSVLGRSSLEFCDEPIPRNR